MTQRTMLWVFIGFLTSVAFIGPAQANTLEVAGTLNRLTTGPLLGTTFDTWKINIPTGGNFSVDVLAYEASQSNVATAGYGSSDLNGDGELTWLDADTYFYRNTGAPLSAADALVRADDINNNTPVYQNGLTALTSPVTVTSLTQAEGATDGSIHFRRDPAYTVTAAPGNYLLLMADFRLDSAEAAGGINTNDNFSPPTGFVGGITDHADYRFRLSSSTLNFSIDGNTITVAPVPVPAAVWLFGSGLVGLARLAQRRLSAYPEQNELPAVLNGGEKFRLSLNFSPLSAFRTFPASCRWPPSVVRFLSCLAWCPRDSSMVSSLSMFTTNKL